MVSKRTEDVIKQTGQYLIGLQVPIGSEPWLVIEKGHGVWLVDTEGREGIDMPSSGGCSNLGHGHKEIIDAMLEQLNKIEFGLFHRGLANSTVTECAKKLVEVTPEGLDHVNFTGGGAEATDLAFRMTYLYWTLKGERRWKIISHYGGYYGMGAGAWASSRKGFVAETWGPPAPGFVHIPSYHCYRCMFGLKYPDCDVRCARYLAEVIDSERQENVAAFIGESVLGGSGHIPPPPEYWPIVRKICDQYDILLIADEVQVGFARTGKMFALENWGVKPDIMTMAKSLSAGYVPFGAIAINNKVYQVVKDFTQDIAYTFSSHPLGCAATLAALNIYIRDKVADNAAKVGKHIYERLQAEFKSLPCVDNITGLGMSLGIDIVADKKAKAPLPPAVRENICRESWEKGLYNRYIAGIGGTRLMIYPPCIMTLEEADIMLDRLLPIIAAIKT